MNDLNASLGPKLKSGLQSMGIDVNSHQQERMLTYLAEFHKWNKAYNLSAVREPELMLYRHLLDSLSVLPHVSQKAPRRVIDVGTGGGLPGIPLAIALPDCQFTLLDSNGKKTRFLFHIKTLLGLDNVQVENCRVEQYQIEQHRPDTGYDIVISRAFASLKDMIFGCEHLLASEGLFMAMKGIYPQSELDEITERATLLTCHSLDIPGSEGERNLLELKLN